MSSNSRQKMTTLLLIGCHYQSRQRATHNAIAKAAEMTNRQLSTRINKLRDEARRLRVSGRTVKANKVEFELMQFVHERMRRQARKKAK